MTARIRIGWVKFREHGDLLFKAISSMAERSCV